MDKLRALQYFASAAHGSSLSAAAREHGVSVAAIAKLIAALEADLGVQLLERRARGVVLTAAGGTYLEACRPALTQLAAAEEQAAASAIGVQGTVVVAVQPVIAQEVLTAALPSLGSDMDEGTLVKWLVQPGDAVHKGQIVAVVDTAKAAIDIECWHEGTVQELLIEPGTKLAVGAPMAWLRAAGETAPSRPSTAAPAVPAVQPAPPTPRPATAAPVPQAGERLRISPAARRAAHERGIDLHGVRGSGPHGAISLADLPAAAPAVPDRAAEMRRVIGAAMSRAKREIPHYYLSDDIAFEAAAAWLAERNRDREPAQRLLPAALLLKAVAMALRRYPEFNGFWRDGGFVAGSGIHLGVAIALRGGGLVAPALHDVDGLDSAAITGALLDLVRRTRAGSLRSSEIADATLTVTNLGEHSVASVFGVIYPPQVALVGFGRIATRPWIHAQGGVRALPMLTATLAADHRASDGHRGALLLAEIRELLQEPQALDASA